MIKRYTLPEMGKIWTLHNQYKTWLKVEIAVCEGWAKLGKFPESDVEKIKKNAKFTDEGVAKIEAVTHHDMVAFTRDVSKSLGPERKWIHYGVTSTDIEDTAYGLCYKAANKIIRKDLETLKETVGKQAEKYKMTVEIGRTHGVHAEPLTFGLKLARWYSALKRDIKRFDFASKEVEACEISGAVGTFANVPPQVEEYVAKKLGLHEQEISSQILPRDLHADYISMLALIATTIETMATEIRSLQRTEIHEVEEHFAKGQKGSSAMPHKRNPVLDENLCGLARVVRGHMISAYEDVPLWHERDISHSSVERIIMPDTTILIDFMLHRFNRIIGNLTVFPDQMKKNLNMTHGLVYSQRFMLKLIETGLTREQAYDIVQPLAMKAWNHGLSFKHIVENNPVITKRLSQKDIDDAFDYHYHLRYVNYIFKKVGLK